MTSKVLRNGAPLDAPSSERATTRLARDGILLPDRPDWPQMPLPEDITSISDESLIELYVRVTTWTGFLATRSAAAMVDERSAETALEVEEAKALLASWGGTKDDRVTVAKAERMTDPRVIKLRQIHEDRYAERKLLEVLSGHSERNASLISRELTRRTSGPAPERRASRFTSN